MKNKKSQAEGLSYAGVLILALAFVFFGLSMIRSMSETANAGYEKALCRETVILNAVARVPFVGGQQLEIKCPTRYVTIYGDVIKEQSAGMKEPKTEKIKCLESITGSGKSAGVNINNERSASCYMNATYKKVANLIYDCWYQFYFGKRKVFSDYKSNIRQCLVCSRIEYDESAIELIGRIPKDNIIGLNKYMETHAPGESKIVGEEKSYYFLTLDRVDRFRGFEEYDFNIDTPMAVVFKSINKNKASTAIRDAWDLVKEKWTDAESGDTIEFVNVLDFVPYSEVKDECDTLN